MEREKEASKNEKIASNYQSSVQEKNNWLKNNLDGCLLFLKLNTRVGILSFTKALSFNLL